MAKQSMIQRDLKRARIVNKYAKKRAELKAIIADGSTSYEDMMEAQVKLQNYLGMHRLQELETDVRFPEDQEVFTVNLV